MAQGAETPNYCELPRVVDVMAGTRAIYRVNVAGQRATLEIALRRDGKSLAIDEFRLACDAEPSEADWGAARQWLAEGQRRRRDREGR